MDKEQAAVEIRRVLQNELDDCRRAMSFNDYEKAKRELRDAVDKLEWIVRSLL